MRKLLCYLLTLILVISAMVIPATVSAVGETKTEAQLIGQLGREFSLDYNGTGLAANEGTDGDGSAAVTVSNGYLNMPASSIYNLPSSTSAFGVGDVFHIRFTYAGNMPLNLYPDSGKSRLRIYMDGNSKTAALSSGGSYTSLTGITYETGKTYDWVIFNQQDGFEIWAQKEGAGYTCLGTVTKNKTAGNAPTFRNNSTTNDSRVDFIRIYSAEEVLNNHTLHQSWEFNVNNDFCGGSMSLGTGSVSGGNLILDKKTSDNPTYAYTSNHIMLVENSSIHFRYVATGAEATFVFYGASQSGRGKMRIRLALTGSDTFVAQASGTATMKGVKYTAGNTYDVIAKYLPEGIKVYVKETTAAGVAGEYVELKDANGASVTTGISASDGTGFTAANKSSSTAMTIDFIRVYLPSQYLFNEADLLEDRALAQEFDFNDVEGGSFTPSDNGSTASDGILTVKAMPDADTSSYWANTSDQNITADEIIQFRFTASSQSSFEFWTENGTNRIRLTVYPTYFSIAEPSGIKEFRMYGCTQGKSYDVILVNGAEKNDIYIRDTPDAGIDTPYFYAGSSSGKNVNSGNGIKVANRTMNNDLMVEYIKVYSVIAEEEDLLKNQVLRKAWEFEEDGNAEGGTFSGDGSVLDGYLNIPKKVSDNLSWAYTKEQNITTDEAMQVRFTASNEECIEFWTDGGSKRFRITPGTNNLLVQNATKTLTIAEMGFTAGTTYDLIVLNRADYYELWVKEAESENPYKRLSVFTKNANTGKGVKVSNRSSSKELKVDFIRIYRLASFTATATGDGKMIFACYDEDGDFAKAYLYDTVAGETITCDVPKEEIVSVKVFLWDNFITMNAIDGFVDGVYGNIKS